MKANLILMIIILLTVIPVRSQENCRLQYTYRVEKEVDNNLGKIYITLRQGDPHDEYILWDIYKNEQLQKRNVSVLPDQEVLLFEDVPVGNYAIVVNAKGCKTTNTIGGIEGIDIK